MELSVGLVAFCVVSEIRSEAVSPLLYTNPIIPIKGLEVCESAT